MKVKKVMAKCSLLQKNKRIALQRGLRVYCVEGVDNNAQAWNMVVPENTSFMVDYNKDLLNVVVTLKAEVPLVDTSEDDLSMTTQKKTITAISYYAWANRGKSPMQVWLPAKASDIKISY